MERSAKPVYNVGCNEDPAGLKHLDPDRVVNCDIEATDSYLGGRPNLVDVVFDARETWPFDDDSAAMVVLGDILEHLYEPEWRAVLSEARRCADELCVTLPRDDRGGAVEERNGYRTHCWAPDGDTVKRVISEAGWEVTEMLNVNYGFVPQGFFVRATRARQGADGAG